MPKNKMRKTPTWRMLFGFVRNEAIKRERERLFEGLQLFERYVDNIICTVRCDLDMYLKFAKSLHKNLQITLEKMNTKECLVFLDFAVNMSNEKNFTCIWYQKSVNTIIVLNFCSCEPLQHKQSKIRAKVRTVFIATSNWLAFDK